MTLCIEEVLALTENNYKDCLFGANVVEIICFPFSSAEIFVSFLFKIANAVSLLRAFFDGTIVLTISVDLLSVFYSFFNFFPFDYLNLELNLDSFSLKPVALNILKESCSMVTIKFDLNLYSWKSERLIKVINEIKQYASYVRLIGSNASTFDMAEYMKLQAKVEMDLEKSRFCLIQIGKEGRCTLFGDYKIVPITPLSFKSKTKNELYSLPELMDFFKKEKFILPLDFFLIGFPIKHSCSPVMHNTGFQSLFKSKDFGGCSVTIPFKELIISEIDHLSNDARKIGAVNTIVSRDVYGQRELHGYNTDWIGIYNCFQKFSNYKKYSKIKGIGIVIGAGGTAKAAIYALHCLGITHKYIVNRSSDKFDSIKNLFPKSYNLIFLGSEDMIQSIIIKDYVFAVSAVPGDRPLDFKLSNIWNFFLTIFVCNLVMEIFSLRWHINL